MAGVFEALALLEWWCELKRRQREGTESSRQLSARTAASLTGAASPLSLSFAAGSGALPHCAARWGANASTRLRCN